MPAVVPNAFWLLTLTTPLVIVNTPVYTLVVALSPLICKLSTPFLIKPKPPDKPPEKLVRIGLLDEVVTPVNVNEPVVLEMVPAPSIVPIISVLLFKSKIAPAEITTVELSLKAALEFKYKVPAATVSFAL